MRKDPWGNINGTFIWIASWRKALVLCVRYLSTAHLTNLIETQTIYLSAVLAAPNLLALKLTFFLLYLQIFYHNVKLRVCIYAGAFLTTIFYMAVGITQFVLGTPPREVTWQDYVFLPGPRRLNTLSIPLAAVGLGIDLYILILPIGGVLQLQMPTRRKIGICLIFVIGILFVFFSMHDFVFLWLTTGIAPVSRLCWVYTIEWLPIRPRTAHGTFLPSTC